MASLPVTNIYVDKNYTGENENVFSSISSAKSYVRNLVMNNRLPEDGICVNIKGGVYNEQLGFNVKDSGNENAPVVYRADSSEKVKLISGYEIPLEDFSVVTDENVLLRLDELVRGKVMSYDLKKKDIDYSRELPITGHSTAYYTNYDYNKIPYYTLSFEGEKTGIARYPNSGYITVDEVISTGTPISEWENGIAEGFTIAQDSERLIKWSEEKIFIWQYVLWKTIML